MYFDTLRIRNFGPFPAFQVSFSPKGITLITGYNGTGKTQLIGAVLYSVFGAGMVSLRSDGQTPSEVSLVIREGEEVETTVCRLDKITSTSPNLKKLIHREVTHHPSDRTPADFVSYLQSLFTSTNGPSLLLSSNHDAVRMTQEDIARLSRIQVKDSELWYRLLDRYATSKSIQMASMGSRKILRVAQEVVKRRDFERSIPLLLDDPFSELDWEAHDLLGQLLDEIGNRDQVIVLATPRGDNPRALARAQVRLELRLPPTPSVAPLHFNYLARPKAERSTGKRRYVLGQKLLVEENLLLEFKEVKGGNAVRAITEVVDEYVVAYLNMRSQGTGRIFWGIRDEDQSIVGVRLNDRERDQVRRLVTEKLHKIEPKIAPSAYRVSIHRVYDADRTLMDRYVVEVKVPSSPSHLLFATGSHEVYIKTDAGKKRLSPIELQQEVLLRRDQSDRKAD